MITLVITDDHSHTVFNSEINEHYHSTHGAIQESSHIFIDSGFNKVKTISNSINILEVGMGSGLNVLLSFVESVKQSVKVNYIAIEPLPLSYEIFSNLNYVDLLGENHLHQVFNNIHDKTWDIPYFLSDNFILNKIKSKIQDVQLSENVFDLIYFDAFSPQIEPELWTEHIFKILYNSLKNNGILITYSAKGDVKRALKQSGFSIEIIDGPPGKRHITRARKLIEICNCHHH